MKKPRKFKCIICEREFLVPHDVYRVNCPCGAIGYSIVIDNKRKI